MEKKSVVGVLWVVVLLAVDVGVRVGGQQVSCSDAVNDLIPCGAFLVGAGGATAAQPSKACCQGVETLSKLAASAQSRKSLCECLKRTAPSFGVKAETAKKLPKLCSLNINLPIDPNVDCTKI